MTRRSHRWVNALFLAPVLIAFIMVMVIPFFLGIYYSMTDFNGVKSELTFVGLKNYQFMFQDPLFLHSFMVTVEYTVINVILVNVVAFALSLRTRIIWPMKMTTIPGFSMTKIPSTM